MDVFDKDVIERQPTSFDSNAFTVRTSDRIDISNAYVRNDGRRRFDNPNAVAMRTFDPRSANRRLTRTDEIHRHAIARARTNITNDHPLGVERGAGLCPQARDLHIFDHPVDEQRGNTPLASGFERTYATFAAGDRIEIRRARASTSTGAVTVRIEPGGHSAARAAAEAALARGDALRAAPDAAARERCWAGPARWAKPSSVS